MSIKLDKFRVGKAKDRRRKLTDEQKEEIKTIYARGGIGQRPLARMFGVSKRTVQFTVFPEKKLANLELRKLNGGSGQYYTKEDHAKAMKSHRHYKRSLMNKEEIRND